MSKSNSSLVFHKCNKTHKLKNFLNCLDWWLNLAGQPINDSLSTFNCDRTESRWGWDRLVFWLVRSLNYFKRNIRPEMPPNLPKLTIQFLSIKLTMSVQGSLYCLHIAKFKKKDNCLWAEGPLWKVRNIHSFINYFRIYWIIFQDRFGHKICFVERRENWPFDLCW